MSDKTFDTVNPFSQATLASYTYDTEHDLDEKLDLAARAHSTLAGFPLYQRCELLTSLKERLLDEKDVHAKMISEEMGKPLTQAMAEIEKCADLCDHYLDHVHQTLQPQIRGHEHETALEAHIEALGVIVGVMPWNYPYWQVFRFAVPSLLVGNGLALKMAENTTGCAFAMKKLFEKALYPDGTLEVLLCQPEHFHTVLEHKGVRGLSFTGSTKVGHQLAGMAGALGKKSVLELGGSDPAIVLEDADLKWAARHCLESRLLNTGQSCIATKRFLVAAKVYDAFLRELETELKAHVYGNPLDAETTLGPLARQDLLNGLDDQLEDARRHGAIVRTLLEVPDDCLGFHAPVSLIENAPKTSRVRKEEVFGPAIALIEFHEEAEAIDLANETSFGLGASIYSQNLNLAKKLGAQIKSGNIALNTYVKSDPRLPFGGVKNSGYGRELAEDGLREFANHRAWIIRQAP